MEESFPRVVAAPSETCVHFQLSPGFSGWAGALSQHVLLRGAIGVAYKPLASFWPQSGVERTYVAPAELSTLLFALAAVSPSMCDNDLTVFCDSLVVVAGVVKGTRAAPELKALHPAIHHWAMRLGCRLHIEYEWSSRDAGAAFSHLPGAGWVLAASQQRGASAEDNIPGGR